VVVLASGDTLGCGGGGAEVKQTTSIMALEKELQDLNEDHQKGPLSEKG
jgi:hypothetical protein